MEIKSEFNKNLKTIFNFLGNLKIKNLKYENKEITGKYANKNFVITKANFNFIITGKVQKLHKVIQAFIDYSNCKKKKIDYVLNEFELGKLHIGTSNLIVTEKRQALAVALNISNKYCERLKPKY